MSDTNPTALPHTINDRKVVFQTHKLGSYPEPQLQELKRWVEDGGVAVSADLTIFLGKEAERVAEVRAVLEEQLKAQTSVEVTDSEWQKLRWAATRTVDGEPRLSQLNEILAASRGPIAAMTLRQAYALVEQDLVDCGVIGISRVVTAGRHSLWAARVLSELRTVQLPDEVSLYDLIHGPLAQAYRARGYNMEMSTEEREAQRRSFAFGNAAISNPNVTREIVDELAVKLESGADD